MSDDSRPSYPRRWLAIVIWCLCPIVGFFAGGLVAWVAWVFDRASNPTDQDPFPGLAFMVTVWPLTFVVIVVLGVKLGLKAWRKERDAERRAELTDEAWAALIDPVPPGDQQRP